MRVLLHVNVHVDGDERVEVPVLIGPSSLVPHHWSLIIGPASLVRASRRADVWEMVRPGLGDDELFEELVALGAHLALVDAVELVVDARHDGAPATRASTRRTASSPTTRPSAGRDVRARGRCRPRRPTGVAWRTARATPSAGPARRDRPVDVGHRHDALLHEPVGLSPQRGLEAVGDVARELDADPHRRLTDGGVRGHRAARSPPRTSPHRRRPRRAGSGGAG